MSSEGDRIQPDSNDSSASNSPDEDESKLLLYEQKFSGPLPPPSILADFDRVQPGFSERIMATFEEQSKHRRAMEARQVESLVLDNQREHENARRGQWFGLCIALAGFMVTVYAISKNAQWVASAIGGGTIASLTATFIVGRYAKSISKGHNGHDDDSNDSK